MTLKLNMCCRGMSNSAAELDHSRNELVLVATRDIQCAAPPPQDQGHREYMHLWFYFHWLLGIINTWPGRRKHQHFYLPLFI